MNVVLTASGQYIEIQTSAEGSPFSRQELNTLLEYASIGVSSLLNLQDEIIQMHK